MQSFLSRDILSSFGNSCCPEFHPIFQPIYLLILGTHDHALCPSVEVLAHFPSVACHQGSLACSELYESGARVVVTNEQATEIFPAGILQLLVQSAAKNRGQHIYELQSKRITRIFKRSLFG